MTEKSSPIWDLSLRTRKARKHVIDHHYEHWENVFRISRSSLEKRYQRDPRDIEDLYEEASIQAYSNPSHASDHPGMHGYPAGFYGYDRRGIIFILDTGRSYFRTCFRAGTAIAPVYTDKQAFRAARRWFRVRRPR